MPVAPRTRIVAVAVNGHGQQRCSRSPRL